MELNSDGQVFRVDSSTGLAFTEHSVSAHALREIRKQPLKWVNKSRGRSQGLKSYQNSSGPDTLQNMAWRIVLLNIHSLDITHLQALPWPIALQFWKRLTKK
jgi:hypothetical protein